MNELKVQIFLDIFWDEYFQTLQYKLHTKSLRQYKSYFYGKSLYFPFFTLLNWWHVKNLWSSSDHQLNFLMAIFWRIFISTERKTTSWLIKKRFSFLNNIISFLHIFILISLVVMSLQAKEKPAKNFFCRKITKLRKRHGFHLCHNRYSLFSGISDDNKQCYFSFSFKFSQFFLNLIRMSIKQFSFY